MHVHLARFACDLDAIKPVAHAHNLLVVEDAAYALPTRYHRRLVGASRLASMSLSNAAHGANAGIYLIANWLPSIWTACIGGRPYAPRCS